MLIQTSDGLEGTIQYRGYSIHDIIGKKKFVDVSHLLIWGDWPSTEEARIYQERLNNVPQIDDSVFNVIRSFPYAIIPVSHARKAYSG